MKSTRAMPNLGVILGGGRSSGETSNPSGSFLTVAGGGNVALMTVSRYLSWSFLTSIEGHILAAF